MARTVSAALGLMTILGMAMAPQDHALADIGTTAAVNPASFGTPPGQVTRVLVPALDVFADERIETDSGGVTQILFRDGSHMTIGPNSDLVIDRFIFDPDTSTGEMAISLGRGVLRFVGGQLSKDGTVTLATPVAVIGVRGGIAVVEHDPAVGTNTVFLFGAAMTVQGIGDTAETVRVSRPGFSVSVGADGAPGPVVPVEPEHLDRVLAAVEGDPESSGDVQDADVTASDPSQQGLETAGLREAVSASSIIAGRDREALPPVPDQPSPAALLVYDLDGITGFRGDIYRTPGATLVRYPLTIAKPEGPFGNASATGGARFLYTANGFTGTGAGQVGEMRVFVGGGFNLIGPSSEYRLFGRLGGSSRDADRNTWMMTGPASMSTMNGIPARCSMDRTPRRRFEWPREAGPLMDSSILTPTGPLPIWIRTTRTRKAPSRPQPSCWRRFRWTRSGTGVPETGTATPADSWRREPVSTTYTPLKAPIA